MEAATDARVPIIAVALTLRFPSVRGLSLAAIAEQIVCSPATITRSMTKFREMSGLVAGGIQFIRPGAGYGDKPPAARA
jgi:hypothetical protein